jgi:hypothetical protein
MEPQLVFLVGIGYTIYTETGPEFKFKYILANDISLKEESRLIDELLQFINHIVNEHNIKYNSNDKARLIHWSPAEKSILQMANNRSYNKYKTWINQVTWIDMCKIFTDEPIVIKGAKKFNLKEVASTMASHQMIKSTWCENGPSDGLSAMLEAVDYYRFMNSIEAHNQTNHLTKEKYLKVMDSIIAYNEIDCKTVYEIVEYLRNNCTLNN